MTKDAASSVCGYEVKDKYGDAIYKEWVATYPWDCNDQNPAVWECVSACVNQPYNALCYHSPLDMDADCRMNNVTGLAYCGYEVKDKYGDAIYKEWVATYPWDCNDQVEAECGETADQASACVNQSYNALCYHSPLDMDADCRMNNVTGLAYCGYEVKDKYGDAIYKVWVAMYPWDAKDTDPQQ
jgi:hypothetical protein